MAKKIIVGAEITGDASSLKKAASDASKAVAEFQRNARQHARDVEQSFKMVTIAIAKIGAAVLIAKKAFDIYKQAMNTTEGSADKLEQQMGYLKGTVQGTMQTLFSGDWFNLITNIRDAAEATRDLAKAEDELQEAKARNALSRGDLEIQLNAAKLAAAEEPGDTKESKARKKGYLQDAMNYQRQITAINVSEAQKRVDATTEYYRKVFNQDEEYWNYVKSNIVTVAKNYDYFYSNLANYQAQLDKINLLGAKTGAEETERRRLQLLIYLLEDYTKLQSELSKKGQFDQFLIDIGAVSNAAAQGDQDLLRLTKQVTTLGTALEKTGRIAENSALKRLTSDYSGGTGKKGEYANAPTPFSYAESFGSFRFADEFKSEIEKTTPYINELTSTFENMFANVDQGFKGMIESLLQSLKKLLAFMAAKAAVFGLINLLTGGSLSIAKGGMGFMKYVFGGSFAGGTNFAPGGLSLVGEKGPELVNLPRGSQVIPMRNQKMTIEVVGKLKAKDIQFALSRYNAELYSNT